MLMSELNRVVVAPHVDGHQRDGPRLHLDDDLRLPRARDGPRLLREDHRPADEPQLHPPRRRGGRPARRLGGRRARSSATPCWPAPTSTTSCSPASRSSASGPRASAASRAEEALALSATGPILRSTGVPWDLRRAMPYLAYDQVDFDVIVGHLRRQLRPLRHPPQRDPRVDPDRPPDRRADAARRLPGAGPQGHPAAPRPHRRVDGGADPPLQDVHRGLPGPRGRGLRGHRVARGASSAATWSPTAPPSPTGCTSGARASSTCRRCRSLLRGGLIADAVAVISSVDPVMGEVDR